MMSKKDKRLFLNWELESDLYILEIRQADVSDAGNYTLQVVNNQGTATAVVPVVVHAAGRPTVTAPQGPVNVTEGGTIRLTCTVTG